MNLKTLYPQLTVPDRESLAAKVGITPGYLWQISTGWTNKDGIVKRASLDLICKLAAADTRLDTLAMVEEFRPAQKATA